MLKNDSFAGGPADSPPFDFTSCPLCHAVLETHWLQHACPCYEGPDAPPIHAAPHMWETVMRDSALLQRLLGEDILSKGLEEIFDKMAALLGHDRNDALGAIVGISSGWEDLTYCFSRGDNDEAIRLASHWRTVLIRRGYMNQLCAPAMVPIAFDLNEGHRFLLHYLTAIETCNWGRGRRADGDPYEMEAVSNVHRHLRTQLETQGCHFFQHSETRGAFDFTNTLKFLDTHRAVDILSSPLIRPKWTVPCRLPAPGSSTSQEEHITSCLPIRRQDTKYIQLILKMEAMLNLTSTELAREACCGHLPEELVRQIQEGIPEGLVKESPHIMRAIFLGEDLSPYISLLQDHTRILMNALEEEPVFERLFLSFLEPLFGHILYREVTRDRKNCLKDLLKIPAASQWIRKEYEDRFQKTYGEQPSGAAFIGWKALGQELRAAFVKQGDKGGTEVSDEVLRSNLDTFKPLKSAVISLREFHEIVDEDFDEDFVISRMPRTIFRSRRMSAPDVVPEALDPCLRFPTARRGEILRRGSVSMNSAGRPDGSGDRDILGRPHVDVSSHSESAHGRSNLQQTMKARKEEVVYKAFYHRWSTMGRDFPCTCGVWTWNLRRDLDALQEFPFGGRYWEEYDVVLDPEAYHYEPGESEALDQYALLVIGSSAR